MTMRARLLGRDLLHLANFGLLSRPMRAVLSALGIAIGIAAMTAVVGISTSSQARLNAQFAELGTNLLTVTAGKGLGGQDVKLPVTAPAQIRRIDGVTDVGSVAVLNTVFVYRTQYVDPARTAGLFVAAAELGLAKTVGARFQSGHWLGESTRRFPVVVLGSKAAERLGIRTAGGQVFIGGGYYTVVGILTPLALAPELDPGVFLSTDYAIGHLDFTGEPTTVYERSTDDSVRQVRDVLAATVDPANPSHVAVSRPSDALAAKYATDRTFTGLLVGLGSVALLVGGIGVANTMIISVLERRREIGLRRSLGATRAHIRVQFLTEAVLLSALGGAAGALLGFALTAAFALANGWILSVPPAVFGAGIVATIVIGAMAGLYPAIRASRLPPTAALAV